MSACQHCAPNPLFNYRDTSVIFMFIWDYYLNIIVYVYDTVVTTCDVIINFYVINFSWESNQSENLEELISPVLQERSEIEEALLVIFSFAILSPLVIPTPPKVVWIISPVTSLFKPSALQEYTLQDKVLSQEISFDRS